MADWQFAIGPASGSAPLRELTLARSRSLIRRLDGDEARFTIDGRSDEAGSIVELATDLWVRRDGVLVFRGRIGPTQDTISSRVHTVSVAAWDYRALLDRRHVVTGVTSAYTSTEQAAIVADLIDDTEALTGGALGSGVDTSAVGTTGQSRDRTYKTGDVIGRLLTQLGEVNNGFEWWIDPTLVVRVFYPERGSDKALVLDYGGVVEEVQRTYNPDDFANVVGVLGNEEATTPAYASTAGLSTDPKGRWERIYTFADVVEQDTLDGRATALLAAMSRPAAGWRASLLPGRWGGFSALDVGDRARLAVYSPPRFVASGGPWSSTVRVLELAVQIDDSGAERVTLQLEERP